MVTIAQPPHLSFFPILRSASNVLIEVLVFSRSLLRNRCRQEAPLAPYDRLTFKAPQAVLRHARSIAFKIILCS